MHSTTRIALLCFGGALSSFGSLLYLGPQPGGGGFGSVPTILTIQSPGNATTASGCMFWNGSQTATGGENPNDSCALSGGMFLGGDEKSPSEPPHNQAVLLAAGGPQNLEVFYNSSQPGGGPVTINNLILTLYSSTGSPLWSSGALACNPASHPQATCNANGSLTITNTQPGVGNAGFLFALDRIQAAAAAQAVGNLTGVHIGLAASLSGAIGGQETFTLSQAPAGSGDQPGAPEPATYALIGGGLVALTVFRRRS